MGGFRGERGLGRKVQQINRALHERVRFQEVRAGSLQDFARRVAAHPYYRPQPGDLYRAVFPEARIQEAPRVPELHVTARPTYRGFELSATTDTGPRRITYQERDPNPPKGAEIIASMQRQGQLLDEQHEASRQADARVGEVRGRQVPAFSDDILAALEGRLRQGVDFLEAIAEAKRAYNAEGDLLDKFAAERDLRAYQTFRAREGALQRELQELVPGAVVTIFPAFGREDIMQQVVAEHPDVKAWPEPGARRTRRTWKREGIRG